MLTSEARLSVDLATCSLNLPLPPPYGEIQIIRQGAGIQGVDIHWFSSAPSENYICPAFEVWYNQLT